MRYSTFLVTLSSLLLVSATAINCRTDQDDLNGRRQPRLCRDLPVKGGGCIRYVHGFDVTGVTTEINIKFPQIKNLCDCISACLQAKETCANYVWKFTDSTDVSLGHRSCTLYSNFNLPVNVTVVYDANNPNNVNIQPLLAGNNPQAGALVPEAFKDVNVNTTFDPEAVSGPLFALADGSVVC